MHLVTIFFLTTVLHQLIIAEILLPRSQVSIFQDFVFFLNWKLTLSLMHEPVNDGKTIFPDHLTIPLVFEPR